MFFLGFCLLQTIACICWSIDQGTVKGDREHLGRDDAGIDECGQGQCKYCVQLAFLWTEQFLETILKSQNTQGASGSISGSTSNTLASSSSTSPPPTQFLTLHHASLNILLLLYLLLCCARASGISNNSQPLVGLPYRVRGTSHTLLNSHKNFLFTKEITKAQRGEETCPRSQSW